MKKGYEFLIISFVATVISSFVSKIGAVSFDKLLFIFISYLIGSAFTLIGHSKTMKNPDRKVKNISIKFGVIVGAVNFISYFTLLSALSAGPGSIIYPLIGFNIALIVIFSIIFFKERLNWKGVLGFILALISIWLLK